MSGFLDSNEEIDKHGGRLPHWQQGEAMQFVTFRLADAMPAPMLADWREKIGIFKREYPEPWDEATRRRYHKRFTNRIEQWLDQGMGSCLFRDEKNRGILAEVMGRGEGKAARHQAWVIMPNHVHLLFEPLMPLPEIIKIWKGVSSRKIGRGRIWQKNYRDTLIRDSAHFANAVRYIRKNPRGLPTGTFTLWESDRAKAVI